MAARNNGLYFITMRTESGSVMSHAIFHDRVRPSVIAYNAFLAALFWAVVYTLLPWAVALWPISGRTQAIQFGFFAGILAAALLFSYLAAAGVGERFSG